MMHGGQGMGIESLPQRTTVSSVDGSLEHTLRTRGDVGTKHTGISGG